MIETLATLRMAAIVAEVGRAEVQKKKPKKKLYTFTQLKVRKYRF